MPQTLLVRDVTPHILLYFASKRLQTNSPAKISVGKHYEPFRVAWFSAPKSVPRGAYLLVLIVFTSLHVCPAQQSAQFIPLTNNLNDLSWAWGVSPDGSTVLGSIDSTSPTGAFYWKQQTGLQYLPGSGYYRGAYAASYDGSIIAGADNGHATFWTAPDYWHQSYTEPPVFPFPPLTSFAAAISRDGTVLVGKSDLPSPYPRHEASYFTRKGGTVRLGYLGPYRAPNGIVSHNSEAYATSADGSIIVGTSASSLGPQAFRWTASTGMQGLGSESDEVFFRSANAMTPDGRTIVGSGRSLEFPVVVRWTESTGVVNLGRLHPDDLGAFANAVTDDGETIVGVSFRGNHYGEQNDFAFIWHQNLGMIALQSYLKEAGADLTGWYLRDATGISADGRVIVGYGSYQGGQDRAFVAILPTAIPEPTMGSIVIAFLLAITTLRART